MFLVKSALKTSGLQAYNCLINNCESCLLNTPEVVDEIIPWFSENSLLQQDFLPIHIYQDTNKSICDFSSRNIDQPETFMILIISMIFKYSYFVVNFASNNSILTLQNFGWLWLSRPLLDAPCYRWQGENTNNPPDDHLSSNFIVLYQCLVLDMMKTILVDVLFPTDELTPTRAVAYVCIESLSHWLVQSSHYYGEQSSHRSHAIVEASSQDVFTANL